MKPLFTKGQLISWKKDRGFGFIKSNTGGKNIFLHISVLPKDSRCPRVGDVIVYQRVVTPKGKIRAAKASIQGVSADANRAISSQRQPQKTSKAQISVKSFQRNAPKHRRLEKTIGLVTVSVIAFLTIKAKLTNSPSPVAAVTQPGCTIKGNISINTGQKIYHLPGMERYDATIIKPEYGEKWFCTETEAVENGWTKATR
ncbi:MAG: cold shock domain-containing protein [Cyanobacteria bacterium P01_H01_bin.21]